MSMLAELVEVVIGVDTHSQTHTAAIVDARTGAVLARATVTADLDGYAELVRPVRLSGAGRSASDLPRCRFPPRRAEPAQQ
jgi:hypothetical protein